MKKYFLSGILILLTICYTTAQTVQTFDGIYKNGKASYQYYKDENGKTVLHGYFKYETTDKTAYSGQFEHNKRTGEWKITNKDTEITKMYINDIFLNFGTINKEIIKTYKNGILDGPWSVKVYNKVFNQQILKNDRILNEGIDGNFKDGKPVGIFTSFSGDTVSFDSDGYLNAVLTLKKDAIEERAVYKNGILISYAKTAIPDKTILAQRNLAYWIDAIIGNKPDSIFMATMTGWDKTKETIPFIEDESRFSLSQDTCTELHTIKNAYIKCKPYCLTPGKDGNQLFPVLSSQLMASIVRYSTEDNLTLGEAKKPEFCCLKELYLSVEP